MTHHPIQAALRISLAGLVACAVAGALIPARAVAGKSTATAATKSTPETALHRIQRTVARIDAEAKTPEGEAAVLKRLSAQLGASEDSLKLQHGAWGLGYGEIAMAYGFAKASKTGKTPADVVAMRAEGTGWLEIAKGLGVKVDQVANRMKRHVTSPRPR
jgi:hypothetical protein